MIALKIHFITINFCRNEELEKVKKEVFSTLDDFELVNALNILFTKFKVEYNKISNIKIPNYVENIYSNKILKALDLSQKLQKDILLRNDLDFIDHNN